MPEFRTAAARDLCPLVDTSTLSTQTPYWRSPNGDATLYLGDVRACLRQMRTRSVHCVVTSPPYWQQRVYEGGEGQLGQEEVADCLGWAKGDACGECFVCRMVQVFSEVRRVLRDDGTLWLNLGDTFNGGQGMVPAAVAMALRADGWKLVQDIIWHSPNKMPESATNRCTRSHEHLLLLSKCDDYYFDHHAIREPSRTKPHRPGNRKVAAERNDGCNLTDNCRVFAADGMSNRRDVWTISTRGYDGAHYAVMPAALVEPCVLAGTSEYGCCAECERPYERMVVKEDTSTSGLTGGAYAPPGQPPHSNARENGSPVAGKGRDRSMRSNRNGLDGSGSTLDTGTPAMTTLGWRRVCGCQTSEVVPALVLDPFVGSGTTVVTAIANGRHGAGIDLSEEYLANDAVPRITAAIPTVQRPRDARVVRADAPPRPAVLR